MSILLESIGDFAVLRLDRPEALNALSFSILEEIDRSLDRIAKTGARALLVTGSGGKAFCAGADIKELTGRSLSEQRNGTRLGQAVFAKLADLPMPSVAVVNGYAFGGGLEMALACTFRVAGRNARFGLPEIKLGLIPGYGGTQRLPRLIGEGRALELILTGRTVAAEEAERIGLVNRLIDEPHLEAAVAFSREFAGYSRLALQFARSAVRRAHGLPVHEGLKVEADLSTLAYQTEDSVEGMTAFIEKRKPDFRDR